MRKTLLLLAAALAVIVTPLAPAQTPVLVIDSASLNEPPKPAITPEQVEASATKWIAVATFLAGTLATFAVYLLGKINEVRVQVKAHTDQLSQQQAQLNTHALQIPSTVQNTPTGPSLVPLIIAAFFITLLGTGCTAAQRQQDAKAVKAQLADTDVSISGSYDGVTVTGKRVNGRNAVDLNVDPKEVVQAIER